MPEPNYEVELKRICVPTDFSDSSDHAITYGVSLARKFGSEVHLLHVLSDFGEILTNPDFTATGVTVHEYLQAREKGATEYLARLAAERAWKDFNFQRAWRYGNVSQEICRYAHENAIELLVLGTHGRTGLKHLLMGSVAERVVRAAPCPVLTIRHPTFGFLTSQESHKLPGVE